MQASVFKIISRTAEGSGSRGTSGDKNCPPSPSLWNDFFPIKQQIGFFSSCLENFKLWSQICPLKPTEKIWSLDSLLQHTLKCFRVMFIKSKETCKHLPVPNVHFRDKKTQTQGAGNSPTTTPQSHRHWNPGLVTPVQSTFLYNTCCSSEEGENVSLYTTPFPSPSS